jgi:ABC-type branched-subunit amino acid transport system substrate-binding protein
VLVSTACGSRLPDEVLESLDARTTSGTANGTSQASSGSSTGAGTSTGTGTASTTGGGSTSSGPSSSGGGSGPSTGPAAGPTTAAASKCKDAKSAAPGVTDTEIKVASIVTDSGPLPGATEGAFRGAAAYFAMVNANGGLCGRKVTLVKGDDGLDPAKGRGEFLRLEPQVLAFVGSFAVADSGYTNLIESSKVPYVSLVVDPEGRGPRNVFPRTASGYVNTGPFVYLRQKFPKVKKAAVLYADVGGVSANVPGFEAALKRVGFDRRYTSPAEVTSPDFTPEVRQAQDEGIQFFYLFAFEVNMHVRMVRNMRQQNYDPPIKGANIAFNTRFSQLLGRDGDGWVNHNAHLLFLDPKERARSEGLAQFLDWNERVFPGAQLDLFPVSGWGRAAIFTEAMQKMQGSITREGLINALYTIKQFDGGGIEVPINPTTGLGQSCFNMAVHKGGHWVRQYPANKLYECSLGENFKFR